MFPALCRSGILRRSPQAGRRLRVFELTVERRLADVEDGCSCGDVAVSLPDRLVDGDALEVAEGKRRQR